MEHILARGRDNFVETMKRQNFDWMLIDSGMVEEEKPHKPLPLKKEKILKEKVKSKQYI